MTKHTVLSRNRQRVKKGRGIVSSALSLVTKPVGSLINTAIDALPIELHLPGGYQYCGPGTKLKQRLARGDPGINKLDQACKEHDIAYSKFADSANRSVADKILAEKAWGRVKSSDAGVGERASALAVTAAMRTKTAIGGGKRRRRRQSVKTYVNKRGGNIRRRRKSTNKRKKTPSVWSMIKQGHGLYLKPYRVY